MTTPSTSTADDEAGAILVWDRFIRIFHWSLAVAFFAADLSEDDLLGLHVWAGYVVGGLVVARIACV